MNCNISSTQTSLSNLLFEMYGDNPEFYKVYAMLFNSAIEADSRFVNYISKHHPEIDIFQDSYTNEVKQTLKNAIKDYVDLYEDVITRFSANQTKEKTSKLDPKTGTYISIASVALGLMGLFITIFKK